MAPLATLLVVVVAIVFTSHFWISPYCCYSPPTVFLLSFPMSYPFWRIPCVHSCLISAYGPSVELSLKFFTAYSIPVTIPLPPFYFFSVIMSVASSESSPVVRPPLDNGIVRSRRRTWLTQNGRTQLFNRWLPERPPFNLNHSDSDSTAGSWDDTVDEDACTFSLSDETTGFDWVEYPNGPRNYALYVNRRFYVHATEMEATLNARLAAMKADILRALESQRLRASSATTGTVTTAVGLFREHRDLLT